MHTRLRKLRSTITRTKYLFIAILFATLQIFSLISTVLPAKATAAGTVTTGSATLAENTFTLNGSVTSEDIIQARGFKTEIAGEVMDITDDSNSSYIYANDIGGSGNATGRFREPKGVAVDSQDNIYIADIYNYRIQKFDSSGNFILQFGGHGSNNNQFWSMSGGIAIDGEDNVYVSDTVIKKFDSNGNFIANIGADVLAYPRGIVIDNGGNILVSSDQNNYFAIKKFDPSGNLVATIGEQGSGDGQLSSPKAIAIDSSGNIYVADTDNQRIQKFDSSGNFISKWGSNGSGDGQFSSPQGIAIDSSGNIYVADTQNNRIQKFDSNSTFIAKWGVSVSADGQLGGDVGGVASDVSGNIYVSDPYNNRIQKFDSSGNFISKWGSNGSGDGQFSSPQGIAIDSLDNIYVAEQGNYRIQKFDFSGNFLAKFGASSYEGGDFVYQPSAIAVDSVGDIYIPSYGSHSIKKFDSSGNLISEWDNNYYEPRGIFIDAYDNVFVSDKEKVYKLDINGNLQMEFGSGKIYDSTSIAIDNSGNVYVADFYNRVQKFQPNNLPNGNYAIEFTDQNLSELLCAYGTSLQYRAYAIINNQIVYGDYGTFQSDCVSSIPDLKLDITLNSPGLIQGQDTSYSFTLSHVGGEDYIGSEESDGLDQLFIVVPDGLTMSGPSIDTEDGVIFTDGESYQCFDYTPMFDYIPSLAYHLGIGYVCLLTIDSINSGTSKDFTIPFTVNGAVDQDTTIRAMYFGVQEKEYLQLYALLQSATDDAFTSTSNNISIYSGTEPGTTRDDSPEPTNNSDSDPIPDSIEDAAPGNGDGNNDGTPDSDQSNVTSLPIPTGSNAGTYVTLVVPEGSTLTTTAIAQATALATKDSAYDYPLGLMSFTVSSITPGSTIPIELYYYTNQSPSTFTPRKYNTTNQTYTTLSTQTQTSLTQTTINNQPVLKLSYQLQDGGPLDQDNVANGTIIDPVGLAQASVGVPDTGLGTK